MKVICPYCKGTDHFDNSNLTHKYRHSCNKHFKLCPFCQTKYATDNPYSLNDVEVVENIFTITSCQVCNRSWLPDFPTSWTRSFTNLSKVYEFISDIYNNEQRKIN